MKPFVRFNLHSPDYPAILGSAAVAMQGTLSPTASVPRVRSEGLPASERSCPQPVVSP